MKQFFSAEKATWIAPFFMVLFILVIPVSSSLKSIMAGLTLAAILLTPAYRKHLGEAFYTPWAIAAVAFFAYILLSCFWSDAPLGMRLGLIDKYSKLIYLPILAVVFIKPQTRRWTLNAYFAVMLLTCLLSFLKQKGFITLNNMDDSGEVFYNHIATGFMVALAVYFAGILSLGAANKWQRVYYILMMIVGSYQIFFLNTGRTGYVTFVLLMGLLIVQKMPLKKAIFGVVLLCGSIGLVYLASPLMQVRVAALVSDIKFLRQHQEDTSLGFRVQFHQYARNLFERHPVIGLGTGSFKYTFRKEQPIPAWTEKLHDPHSQYWLLLSENGVIGLGFFIIFMASLFFSALKLNKEHRPMLLGLLAVFVLGGLTDSILCYSTGGTLLIVFAALCFGELIEKRAYGRVTNNEVLTTTNAAGIVV